MTYFKQDDDKQYRVVNIARSVVGDFVDFAEDKVNYSEGCVVEVRKADGTTQIHCERARLKVHVGINGQCLHIPSFIPVERLWIREKKNPVIYYKVPSRLQVDEKLKVAYILIPAGPEQVELVGDRYFNAVYELN